MKTAGEFMVVLILVVLAVFVLINAVKNKSNKKNRCLNTKYLKRWRSEARSYIGVFANDNGGYSIVEARYAADYVSDYQVGNERFVILGTSDNEKEAIKICEKFRRKYIMYRLRDKKYGNCERVY